MSRILADAKPAPPRVGCVLLRCRLGARGRDGSTEPLRPVERAALREGLEVIAGRIACDSPIPEVFFLDPTSMIDAYGGADGWAHGVKGYLNARGYGVSVAVADDPDAALEAARARWGVTVKQSRERQLEPARSSAGRIRAPSPRVGAPASGQLALPGLKLRRPRRAVRKPAQGRAA